MNNTDWIDRNDYPFASHYLDIGPGRMHYIDEGRGQPIVMVHGTPTWSFLYRNQIKGLSEKYRCVAPDHIGFGLSDKPEDWSYTVKDHAQNLRVFIETLGLKDITLVVHDFGGPIGLSYAIERPENVSRLVIMNTWMWSLKEDMASRIGSGIFGSSFGKMLFEKFNYDTRVVMKVLGNSYLPSSVHQHYVNALPTTKDRRGTWMFAKELVDSGDWVDGLWNRRHVLRNKPTLILWGLKDRAFGGKYLNRMTGIFDEPRIIRFSNVGHYVQEDMGAELCPMIDRLIEETISQADS